MVLVTVGTVFAFGTYGDRDESSSSAVSLPDANYDMSRQ
jgi:hypothetical protein